MHFTIETEYKSFSFYLNIFRNKFVFDKIEEVFFNEKNKEYNFNIIKEAYIPFLETIKNNKTNQSEIDDFYNDINKGLKDIFYSFNGYGYPTEVFIANLFYGAVREIFKDKDYVLLFTLLEGYPKEDMASLIEGDNLLWFVSELEKANNNEHFKPVDYFRRRNKDVINLFLNHYKEKKIKEVILKNDSISFNKNDFEAEEFFEEFGCIIPFDENLLLLDNDFIEFFKYEKEHLSDFLNEKTKQNILMQDYTSNKLSNFEVFKHYLNSRDNNILGKKEMDSFSFNGKEIISNFVL